MAGRRDKIFYFTADGDAFAPTGFARSHWGPDHLNGPAIVHAAIDLQGGAAGRFVLAHEEDPR